VLSKEGFLYQKYHPDGSWGSTWHAWMNSNREFQLPIQEDETALVLFSLWNHYDQARDIEFIVTLYKPLICRAADFLVQYRDSDSGMILPSYDLWEENYGISTFTASAVFGGLKAASRFAKIFGDAERSEKYDSVATEIQKDILKYLYDEKEGRFLKIIKPDGKGGFSKDDTIDSSIYGIFGFGVLPANDVRVAQTMKAVESSLWVKTDVGGVARYQNDSYQRIEEDFSKVPGNPWPICTLWLAEWYIAQQDLKKGRQLLEWVVDHASQSGILPEQIHPYNNEPLSVSPLTWSHSTFVLTVIEYLNKCSKI
jgi:GH15 family glucan-1,4-alpha-glucosidase